MATQHNVHALINHLHQFAALHADKPRHVNAVLSRVRADFLRALDDLLPVHGYFTDFPLEVLVHTLQHLKFGPDWLRASSVCQPFHAAMEIVAQAHFQQTFGPHKSKTLTWLQSVFEAHHLVTDTTYGVGVIVNRCTQALKCGITTHRMIFDLFVEAASYISWDLLIPTLYDTGLSHTVNTFFWSLACMYEVNFGMALDAIDRIAACGFQHCLEPYLRDLLHHFKPTWRAEPEPRGHWETRLPCLGRITLLVMTDNYGEVWPGCNFSEDELICIRDLWQKILLALMSVDPTFYTLVNWDRLPSKHVGAMLGACLPSTFFLQPFFPSGSRMLLWRDDIANLPATFLAQPYACPEDAGLLHCVFRGDGTVHTAQEVKELLQNPDYVIRDTPLCHYEIMKAVCEVGDLDTLRIVLNRGVNKNALPPRKPNDRTLVSGEPENAPLLTFLLGSPRQNTLEFVTTMLDGGYPCLVCTPALRFLGDHKNYNETVWSSLKKTSKIPAALLPDVMHLLKSGVGALKCSK